MRVTIAQYLASNQHPCGFDPRRRGRPENFQAAQRELVPRVPEAEAHCGEGADGVIQKATSKAFLSNNEVSSKRARLESS